MGRACLLEALIGGLGALLVLLFVFGTLPAVLMPLVVAVAAILNTFTLVWALTYVTDVSIIVQFLIALVGLGVAIDYALLMIFRFRDELRDGNDVESALVQTMTHAGRSVILSGTTVALGLLALLVVPLPLLRSMSLGGMLIPVVSVLAATTLLPALLAVTGTRINSVRVMPRRFLDRGHPEDGAWGRWARFVIRRPVAIGLAGLVDRHRARRAGHPAERERHPAEVLPRHRNGDRRPRPARLGRHQPRRDETAQRARRERRRRQLVAAKLSAVPGVAGAAAPPDWQRGSTSLVEGFPAIDGAAPGIQGIVDRVNASLKGTDGRLTGITAVDRDFLHALFGSFPVRHRARHDPDPDPADPRVPVVRAGPQGRGVEPVLACGRVRHRRVHLPAGPRLLAVERRRRRSPSPPTSR